MEKLKTSKDGYNHCSIAIESASHFVLVEPVKEDILHVLSAKDFIYQQKAAFRSKMLELVNKKMGVETKHSLSYQQRSYITITKSRYGITTGIKNTHKTEDLATRDTFQKAMENHKLMIQKYKRYCDRKVCDPFIAIGSRVYCKTNKIKVGHSRDLSKTYFGPLRVVGVSDIDCVNTLS